MKSLQKLLLSMLTVAALTLYICNADAEAVQLDGLLILGEQGEVEAQLQLGDAYYFGKGTAQDPGQAFFWYERAARQGHPEAQRALGAMYKLGRGTAREPEMAAYWYRKAADQGYAMAQTNLGVLYETGEGVAQNYDTARNLYEKAAKQNDARGQTYLGRMYEFGTGVAVNYTKAFNWYLKAAEQGYARAQTNLGALYEAGQGKEQNYEQAVAWYTKAAGQGYARGQLYLGRMFELGLGVEKDLARAADWYSKAAAMGYARAGEQLARMNREYGKTDKKTKEIENIQGIADQSREERVTAAPDEMEQEDPVQVSVPAAQSPEPVTTQKVPQELNVEAPGADKPSPEVDTMPVEGWQAVANINLGEMEEPVDFDGIIEPFVIIDVGTPVEGLVQDVMVERSNVIKAGQLLIKLDSSVEKALVNKARSRANNFGEIEMQKEKLAFAERAHDRIDGLYTKKAISNQKKDEAYTEVTIARQRLQKAEEERQLAAMELKQAQALLAQRYVKSPISGVVVDRYISQGEFVDNQPLLRIAQIDPLRVEVIVPSHMFGKIKPGMRATVLPELQEFGNLSATVTIVDRVIDAASNSFAVRLEMPNPDYIIPSGLKCAVRFIPEPASALAAIDLPKKAANGSALENQPVP